MDQSRKIVLWSAAILLPAAFYFSAIADLPHITVITVILLVVASLKSTGWRVSDRSVIYLTVLAMAITLFGNYLAPLKQDRFGFMAIFSRPNLPTVRTFSRPWSKLTGCAFAKRTIAASF